MIRTLIMTVAIASVLALGGCVTDGLASHVVYYPNQYCLGASCVVPQPHPHCYGDSCVTIQPNRFNNLDDHRDHRDFHNGRH